MGRKMYFYAIRERIETQMLGSTFIISDFRDITSSQNIKKALSRLAKENTIKRVVRGVYQYSGSLSPDENGIDKVALSIAKGRGWKLIPCGETALRFFGFNKQEEKTLSYITDGKYKTYEINGEKIVFKKSASKSIFSFSYITALTVQALKALGKGCVTMEAVFKIAAKLTVNEKEIILREAKSAASWIYEKIKLICKIQPSESANLNLGE